MFRNFSAQFASVAYYSYNRNSAYVLDPTNIGSVVCVLVETSMKDIAIKLLPLFVYVHTGT